MAIEFEIMEHVGILATNNKGWQKELNLVSWNGRPAKFDLRDWSSDHQKMGKGVTLSNEELGALKELLEGMSF